MPLLSNDTADALGESICVRIRKIFVCFIQHYRSVRRESGVLGRYSPISFPADAFHSTKSPKHMSKSIAAVVATLDQ